MSIRAKILFIVSIPIIGLLLAVAGGAINNHLTGQTVNQTTHQTFMPIIEEDMPLIRRKNEVIQLILNADRDGYQARVAEMRAIEASNLEVIKIADQNNLENLNDVEKRVTQTKDDLNPQELLLFEKFNELFPKWQKLSRNVVTNAYTVYETTEILEEEQNNNLMLFAQFRSEITQISESVANALLNPQEEDSSEELINLFGLLTKADRDAYQALVFLTRILNTRKLDIAELLKEELDNTTEMIRVTLEIAAESLNEEQQKVYDLFKTDFANWCESANQLYQLNIKSIQLRQTQNTQTNQSEALFTQLRDEMLDKLQEALAVEIEKLNQEAANKGQQASVMSNQLGDTLARNNLIAIIAGIVVILLAIICAFFISSKLYQTMKDLGFQLEASFTTLSEASIQLEQSSHALADGSSEQASSLEEISASLEEITSMTKLNASNTHEVKKLMDQAVSHIQHGQSSSGRMQQAMDQIKTSSDETANIIQTIDNIAFQTNLLALNAAVEAARAGEAGKGFAVVAEEVRNLASRSAEAARNTSELIEQVQVNSEKGVSVVTEVNAAFSQITETTDKVNQFVGEVSQASDDQAQGIEHVNTGVAQLDLVTQQNAASSEETASTSSSLNQQADLLNDIIHKLKKLIDG